MITMLKSDRDNKLIRTFRIPLDIVQLDQKQEQNRSLTVPRYGGDLLIIVTYGRNIIKVKYFQNISNMHDHG